MVPLAGVFLALCAAHSPQPSFPIGARPELISLVRSIQEAISKGDFTTAETLSQDLPKADITLGWDESAVPENMREDVDKMRDRAIGDWQKIPNVHIKVAATGDVNISFRKILPEDQAGLPEESVLTFGTHPRLKVEIGLHRGAPPQPIIPAEAGMEVDHALGAFFGNADDALPGNCMFRTNVPGVRVFGASSGNLVVAKQNLAASDAIRELIVQKKPIDLAFGKSIVTPSDVNLGTVRQGVKSALDFTISNPGTGPLNYNLVPDCGCFTRTAPGVIPSGGKVTVRTLVDTLEYVGEIHKMLVLYTNDPDRPVQEIPVVFNSTPPARLYRPEGDVVSLPVAKNTIDVFLTVPDGSTLKPSQFDWNGFAAKVSMEPWSGVLSDFELNQPPRLRHGFVFHVTLTKPAAEGRSEGTLHVITNDDVVPDMRYTLFAQKGIIATPEDVFLGAMSGVGRHTFLVSRPAKPFKVLRVDTGTKCLTATVTPYPKGDEYKIDIFYMGGAPKGDFAADVRVLTSDPAQPVVHATLRGTVY